MEFPNLIIIPWVNEVLGDFLRIGVSKWKVDNLRMSLVSRLTKCRVILCFVTFSHFILRGVRSLLSSPVLRETPLRTRAREMKFKVVR
jgi:hypothetical protein